MSPSLALRVSTTRISGTAENSHEETTEGVVLDEQNRDACFWVHGWILSTMADPESLAMVVRR
jgi:hypothetical protein